MKNFIIFVLYILKKTSLSLLFDLFFRSPILISTETCPHCLSAFQVGSNSRKSNPWLAYFDARVRARPTLSIVKRRSKRQTRRTNTPPRKWIPPRKPRVRDAKQKEGTCVLFFIFLFSRPRVLHGVHYDSNKGPIDPSCHKKKNVLLIRDYDSGLSMRKDCASRNSRVYSQICHILCE